MSYKLKSPQLSLLKKLQSKQIINCNDSEPSEAGAAIKHKNHVLKIEYNNVKVNIGQWEFTYIVLW